MEGTQWIVAGAATVSLASRSLAIALWIGLGILTLSLIILGRTRWGQARPLSKCVALSVLAHMLLVGYAYGTRLFLGAPALPADQPIHLTVLADFDEPIESEKTRFWEAPLDSEVLRPMMPEKDRQSSTAAENPDRMVEREIPTFAPPSNAADVTEAPQAPTTVDPDPGPATLVDPRVALASQAAAIEPPGSAPKPEPPAPPVPQTPVPERATPLEAAVTVKRSQVPQLPSPLVDAGSRVQQLADAVESGAQADAATAETDRSNRSTNRRSAAADETGRVAADVAASAAAAGVDATSGAMHVGTDLVQVATIPRRAADGVAMPKPYRSRVATDTTRIAEQFGGSRKTQEAVAAAHAWLASTQRADGSWDPDAWGAGTETEVVGPHRQGAGAQADTGITGLVVLTYLAAGETHFAGTYRENVQHGLEFILHKQAANGSLAGDARLYARMYCHGMAMLALSESYAMTGDDRLLPYLQRAVQYSVQAQHPVSGGWRYQPGDEGDMSQFGWQVMALASARQGGLDVPERTWQGAKRFLESSRAGRAGGLSGYQPGYPPNETMTAEALTCRVFLEMPLDDAARREAVELVMANLPRDGKANLYYWYYASLALFQLQGDDWTRWNTALERELLARQIRDGRLAGSWNPDTVWGGYGGRVYSTAMATLCLEVYYRYLPMARVAISD